MCGDTSSNDNYVVILIVKKHCEHSRRFRKKYWRNIKRKLRKISPRTCFITVKYRYYRRRDSYYCCYTYGSDKILCPKSLEIWTFCYPSILLMPAKLWNNACIDPHQSLAVWAGVRAFNIAASEYFPKLPHYTGKYRLNTKGVIRWFMDASNFARCW